MKKVLYYVCPVVWFVFMLYIGITFGFNGIQTTAWMILVALFLGAYVMQEGYWYGSILGILVGSYFIYMSTKYTSQVLNELIIGIIIVVYYVLLSINVVRIHGRKHKVKK